jgi:selenocysteine lyase/cysteine desulfurase
MKNYSEEFPVKNNLIYLNHAGVSPMPKRSYDLINSFALDNINFGSKNFEMRLKTMKKTRENGAKLINAEYDEIAFVKSTTHGIIICARGIGFKEGDNVIIPEREFPANVIPWLALKKKGVEVRFVKEKNGRFNIDDFYKLVDNKTRVISVSFVEFSTGFRNPIKQISELCKDKGLFFVVDGIQACGVIPIDVKALGIDFMSMDSHKWLLGPEGIGYFYASRDAINKIENVFEGWLSMKNFLNFLDYNQERKQSAARFEEGAPNFIGLSGLLGSSSLILEAGVENIYSHVQTLLDYFENLIAKKGYVPVSPRDNKDERSGIFCFNHPGKDMKKIFEHLSKNNVLCALREGAIRVSPHLYNTADEIESVYEILP